MKYITLLYMVAIAVYNLLGDNDYTVKVFGNEVPIWQVHFNFFVHLTLAFAFWTFWRKAILKTSKLLFLAGFIFECAYVLFQILTLTTKNVAIYLGMINSRIWGIVFFLIALILISFIYVKNMERKTNHDPG